MAFSIFKKKTCTCSRCGKQYEAGVLDEADLCKQCYDEIWQKCSEVYGYYHYATDVANRPHGMKENEKWFEEVAEHRKGILEKYRVTEGITKDELSEVKANYKKFSDDQAFDVIRKIQKTSYTLSAGGAFSGNMFMPARYDGVIADAEEVFAVGYMQADKFSDGDQETLMCLVFTNDPYISAFPIYYCMKKGFFDVFKSKKGRSAIEALFELACPNLLYPVQELKKLEKQIKKEEYINTKVSKEFVLDQVDRAKIGSGVYSQKELKKDIKDKYPLINSKRLLEEYGYIDIDKISEILGCSGMFGSGDYWKKKQKKFNELADAGML